MQRDAQALMDGLGMRVDVRTLVGSLSLAQRQMVEIAKATGRKCRVIAMDEPSATLTDHELENLWRQIRQMSAQGIGIIYISHRMDEVFAISDRVTVLRDGKNVATSRVDEVGREDVLRQMVGRELSETFPKADVEIGRPILEVRGLSRPGVLHDINVAQIAAVNDQIGAGADAILASMKDVAQSAKQVAAVAEEAAAASAQAAAAAKQQARGAEDLAAAIEEIASLAETIQRRDGQ